MSNQIVISSGAKVRALEGVLTGTAGIVNALGINVPSGIPQLDGSGKILVSQLPNSVMEYKGSWNAATNTPTLVNGTGNAGDVYLCEVAGTVNFGAGPITFAVGDQVIYSGTIWQRASGATGTVTSVAVTESGDALTITGSPITTSGTINVGFAGNSGQYVNGAGGLTTFPSLTGFVPYTGATANVDLGTFDLTTDIINLNQLKAIGSGGLNIYSNSGTHIALMGGGGGAGTTFYGGIIGTTASFASNGGSDTFAINHSSGSGVALNITKGGNGEGLYINKTSGSGNAATIIGTLNATTLTANQLVAGSASTDNVAIFTTYDEGKAIQLKSSTGDLIFVPFFNPATGARIIAQNSAGSAYTPLSFYASNFYFQSNVNFGSTLGNGTYTYTLPSATGTIALTSNLSAYLPLTGGTLTGALSGTSASFSSSVTATGGLISNGGAIGYGGGELGFGVTTSGALSAIYTLATGSPTLFFDHRGTSNTGSFAFRNGTGGANTLMTITSAGNVGIGTSSPYAKMDITQDTAGYGGWKYGLSINATDYPALRFLATTGNTGSIIAHELGSTVFLTGTTSTTAGNERMRITSGGDLGIGTSTINYATANRRVVEINGTSTALLAFKTGDVAKSYLFQTGTDFIMTNLAAAGGNFVFENNGSERMRITSGGDILYQFAGNRRIGVDLNSGEYFYGFATNSNARQTRIICAAADDNRGISFETGGTFSTVTQKMLITSGGQVQIKQAGNTLNNDGLGFYNTSGNIWGLIGGGDNNFYIGYNYDARGYFSSSTGVYINLSDKNKKKDFEQSDIGLQAILELKPTLYRMKDDETNGNKELGFIAQEVKEFIPQAYVESEDFIGLNYNAIVAALVKSVQELEARIKQLENK